MSITTFVQVNITKTSSASFGGTVTPNITIGATTNNQQQSSFQGSPVKFNKIFPIGTKLSSIGHIEGQQNINVGDPINVDLGVGGNACSGNIKDPNGLNVVECSV